MASPALMSADGTLHELSTTGTPHLAKQLDRSLGFSSVFSVAVGAMMGSGIFVLPGIAAGIAGPWVSLSYMLAGLLVLPAVLSKAELATAMPVAGGTYVYVDRALGPWMGTIVGFGTWFSLSAKTAFALVGLGGYLVIFSPVPVQPFSMVVLFALLVLNVAGAGKATRVQQMIVAGCLVALGVFVVVGAGNIAPQNFDPAFPSGQAGIVSGAAFVFVSYSGVTKICSIAEEIQNPSRNIPLGMLSAQAVVMLLYVAVSWVITGNVHYSELATDVTPVATVALAFGGRPGQLAMAMVAVAGLISMCNAGILSTSRFPFAMARERLLPSSIGRISERFGTPLPAIVLTGALLVLLITVLPVAKLAKLASGFKIFIFTIVNLSVIVLRESNARWYKPTFRAPFYPWTQIAGILGGFWLLSSLGGIAVVAILSTVLFGSAWYFLYAAKRVQRRSVLSHLMAQAHALRATEIDEATQAEREKVSVIVPVFGKEEHAGRLVRLAASFVEEGALEVLRLIEVAPQVRLTDAIEDHRDDVNRLQRQSELLAADLRLDVRYREMFTHNAKQAILDEAKLTHAEWIVMQWPTRRSLHYFLRHPMALWLDHPPCDLAIFRYRPPRINRNGPLSDDFDESSYSQTLEVRLGYSKVLVWAEPGPYDSLLVHEADNLAQLNGGRITLFAVVPQGTRGAAMEAQRGYHAALSKLCVSPTDSRLVYDDDLAHAVAEVTADFDLLLLSAPKESGIRSLFVNDPEDVIAKAARCSVVRLKCPRSVVHPRLSVMLESHSSETAERAVQDPYIEIGLVRPQKANLIEHVAQRMAEATGASEAALVQVLTEREHRQNTALPAGWALTGGSVLEADNTAVGVFCLDEPIDYASPDGWKVDVLVVVLGPLHERADQLHLKQRIAVAMAETGLLQALRSVKSTVEGYQVFAEALHPN
jgi:amino acid transporter/mannitol/fructose-specific phosphotransferase system IIA component (Ntr-type)